MVEQRPVVLGMKVVFAAMLAIDKPNAVRADEMVPYTRVAPLFAKHCYGCHGPEKPKGNLRIDKLNPDFIKGGDADHWREVLDRLNFGDMPPEKEPALKKEDRELMTAWLDQERRRAALAKNQPANFRRLTRREYERTLQDLLGLPIAFGKKLPDDGYSQDGFRNDGDMLRVSPLQYETYLKIADEALAAAIVSGPEPVVHRYRIAVFPAKQLKNRPGFEDRGSSKVETLPKPEGRPGASFVLNNNKGGLRILGQLPRFDGDGALAPAIPLPHACAGLTPPDSMIGVQFGNFNFRDGEMRVKVRVARAEPNPGADLTRLPCLSLAINNVGEHGNTYAMIEEPIVIDHLDWRTYEFRMRMENAPLVRSKESGHMLTVWNSAIVLKPEKFPPRMKVEWIEIEHPYVETWPPPSHTSILFPRGEMSEVEYAREVVRRFALRAYRGPVAPAELDRLMKYWTKARASSDKLDDSLRETLSAVLTSPRFLGLPASRAGEAKERLTDHELASRLSYFLWSTMPDESLIRLADEQKLRDPAMLTAQVRRMIQDPRAWAFIEQYSEQWLELDRLQRVVINKSMYPGFDSHVADAMRLETIHFFGEVLRGDLSIFQFLDSDFTFVNETLANHYGMVVVRGPAFRKVKLDESLHRGGLLTQASILTGNSDGRDSHPIKRGMWLLKNLLDETPPPPPPNVPELDREKPSVKNLTIPQALIVHRNNAACNGCHRKIDPWGLAFEEYDAVGNWQRDGAGAGLRKRRTTHPIDAKAELPTGVEVDGMRALQAELVRSKADPFRRAMLRKMMAYALGRSLALSDLDAVDALVPALRSRGDRLSALIELIVVSESFSSK